MVINNPKGILLMTIGMALFAFADTLAKVLLENYPALQVVFVRQLGLFSGVTIFMISTKSWVGKTSHLKLQLLRGVCATGSALIFLLGLHFIPLADATSIAFVAPLFVIGLSHFFLDEPLGMRRWIAVIIGFLATLLIIRPGFQEMHFGYLFIISAAFLFALRQIISRVIADTDVPTTTAFYTAYISVGIFSLFQPFVWQSIKLNWDLIIYVAYALSAGVAEFLVIRSLQIAHAVVVSPLQYTILLWVTVYGYIIWGVFPDTWTVLGASIIISTGLYSLYRERKIKKFDE